MIGTQARVAPPYARRMPFRRTLIAAVAVSALALTACGGDDDEPALRAEESTTSTDESTTTTATEAEVVFPAVRIDLEHGGATWAVVLAGSDDGEGPEIEAAVQAAADAGYSTGPTDCDDGAPEALELGDAAYTVSVYFTSEDDAQAALEAFHATGVDGGAVAEVTTYCLD